MERGEEGEEEKVIGEIVSTITAYLHPKRILLFGSRARGRGKHLINLDIVEPEFKALIKEGGRVMSSTEVALFERIEDSYVQVIEQNITQFSEYWEGENR